MIRKVTHTELQIERAYIVNSVKRRLSKQEQARIALEIHSLGHKAYFIERFQRKNGAVENIEHRF